MKVFIALFFATMAVFAKMPSIGCGNSADPSPYVAGVSNLDSLVTPDGRNRTFRCFIPASYSKSNPIPLITFFHGGLGSASQAESAYKLDLLAAQEGFAIVYGDGFGNTWRPLLRPGSPPQRRRCDLRL